jgi:hypothetical protein
MPPWRVQGRKMPSQLQAILQAQGRLFVREID